MNRSTWTKNAYLDAHGYSVRHGQNNYHAEHTYRVKDKDGKKKTVHEDVGIIVPGGIIPLPDLSKAICAPVKEYGFSQACLELLSLKWKNNLGDDWFNVFMTIVLEVSRNSYLADYSYEPYRHRNLGAHRSSMEAYMGKKLTELFGLFGDISIATENGVCVYRSELTPAQIKAAQELEISLGGFVK